MLASWIVNLMKVPVSTRRFTIVTPPLSMVSQHLLYDRKQRKLISVSSRGRIDYATMIQIFYNEEYNLNHLLRLRELNEWFAAIKSRGDKALILDCGANIGLASKYLATEWHGAVVWAVEPSRRNAELAQSNLPEGARLVLGAIGPEDGACYIANPDANPNAYRISTSKEAVGHQSVPMISMSTFIKEAHSGGLEPFILKVDIEGAESALFENANDWLHRWPVLMIELHDWMLPKSASSSAVLKAIAEARRDVVLNGNTLVSLRNGGS